MSKSRTKVALAFGTFAVVTGVPTALPSPAHAEGQLNNDEIAFCLRDVGSAFACYMTNVAAGEARTDAIRAYGSPETDGSKQNAYKHANWVLRIGLYTGSREFAWQVTRLHETGVPYWQTNRLAQMDLHNNRVAYHLLPSNRGPSLEEFSLLAVFAQTRADRALRDSDGVNSDYTRLIYVC